MGMCLLSSQSKGFKEHSFRYTRILLTKSFLWQAFLPWGHAYCVQCLFRYDYLNIVRCLEWCGSRTEAPASAPSSTSTWPATRTWRITSYTSSSQPTGRCHFDLCCVPTVYPRSSYQFYIATVVVVYHVTTVAFGHGLLKKFWPFW